MTVKKEHFANKQWIATGIVWGFVMFLLGAIAIPYFFNEPITWKSVLIGFPIWLVGGLGYGFTMKKYFERELLNKENE